MHVAAAAAAAVERAVVCVRMTRLIVSDGDSSGIQRLVEYGSRASTGTTTTRRHFRRIMMINELHVLSTYHRNLAYGQLRQSSCSAKGRHRMQGSYGDDKDAMKIFAL